MSPRPGAALGPLAVLLCVPLALYLILRIQSSLDAQPSPIAVSYRVVASVIVLSPALAMSLSVWRIANVRYQLALLCGIALWIPIGATLAFILGV